MKKQPYPYIEPDDYFPLEIRKKYKLGEFAEISYEEALNIAKQHKDNIDTCLEYERGFVFSSTEDDKYVGGWGHEPVCVMKDGQVMNMITFIDSHPGEQIGTERHI